MRIHILPVNPKFQPDQQNFISPPHNQAYGVEDDFENWLRHQPELLADNPKEADWDYLPIRWNKLYINWRWGQDGLDEIQTEILRHVSRNRPTFTIVEYDILDMQPFFDLCNMVVFIASRRGHEGIDIPLLCSPHMPPAQPPERQWLASFVGNLHTHWPRPEMAGALAGRDDCYVEHAQRPTEFFVNLLLESYVALAPRGHGGQSFRFYEAMQLGVCPLLIGDLDTRPFRRWLPWEKVSLYRESAEGLGAYLDDLDRDELMRMGQRARDMYHHCLQYGQWGRYVIKELGTL